MIHRLPLVMGLMMGLMLPFMVHNGIGWGFVLGHVAVIALIGFAVILFPKRPAWLSHILSHLLSLSHLTKMGAMAVLGFAIVCLVCLQIDGLHHV